MIPIKVQSDYFIYKEDHKYQIFYTLYTPETKPVIGTMLVIHGMQEHSGRYEGFALYFANRGFAVLAYDHPGHGKTATDADSIGYFRLENPHGLLISVADEIKDLLAIRYPDVPHFILGHSMGSFVTRCLLQQSGDAFSGAIIVGTGGSMVGIGMIKSFFKIANRLNPHRKPSFNNLLHKNSNIRFSRDKDFSPIGWLSLNPENREKYLKDPLCGIPFTNNAFLGLFMLYSQATKKGWTSGIPKTLPILFISGKDDPIGGFGHGVQKSAEALLQDGFEQVEVKLYEHMRHEILNESINQEVFKEIYEWIARWL